MLQFKGELTGECRKAAIRRNKVAAYVLSWILAIIILIPTIIFAFLYTYTALLFCSVPLIIAMYPLFEKDTEKKSYFVTITIDGGEIIFEHENIYTTKYYDFVESVIDHGEYYEIVFVAEEDDKNFRCQKDLLTQGTIEEFEALFDGKIVKSEIK